MNGIDQFDVETASPEQLAAMFEQLSGKETQSVEVTNEQIPEVQAAIVKDTEIEPAGVATRDGKHVIPYSVLKADRDRASRAEQALEEANKQLEEFRANATGQGVKDGSVANPQQSADEMSDDDLEALREDFPTVYKSVMLMRKQSEMMQAQLKPLQDSEAQKQGEVQRSQEQLVRDAIDSTPKLAHIAAEDPAAYELAKQFDNTLKNSAAWAGKPLSERFAKVIEMVESANGQITVPGQSNSKQKKSAEQMKDEAKAIANAQVKSGNTAVPTSLSDFPSGQHAAESEFEAISGMSTLQIAQKFSGMSPETMEAYLSNL